MVSDDRANSALLRVDIATLPRPGGGEILSDIHFTVGEGECLAVIGPNGSGKTSLLRMISQELTAPDSQILLSGRPVPTLTRQQRAQQMALLAQNDTPDLRLTVEDYVALGRIPHARHSSPHEHQMIISRAICECGLQNLRRRSLSALSGGERQRAALARVFAQSPRLVLLDEPTNHLDLPARVELLALVKNKGITVIAVLHDLSLIDSFADRVLLLAQGRMVAWDVPACVLVSAQLYPVFGLTSFTVPHPNSGKPLRIFEVPGAI